MSERVSVYATAEGQRLAKASMDFTGWRLWGPYLPERQWGTVREDYSENGDTWQFFPTNMLAAACTAGGRMAC